jgi:NADH-quinone oxidoreductase subunit J
MHILFYIAAAVAIISTLLMLTRLNAIHALLYLIVSLLAVAIVFYTIGAPFIAALEVIIYAGAIMVLFIFVVMLLNLGAAATQLERTWMTPGMWVGPVILAVLLIGEVVVLLSRTVPQNVGFGEVDPKQVGIALFGPYLIGVELASMLLMGALVGAYHLGRRPQERPETQHGLSSDESRTAAGGDLVHAGADRSAGTS